MAARQLPNILRLPFFTAALAPSSRPAFRREVLNAAAGRTAALRDDQTCDAPSGAGS
jgi:hypothetical protein